MVATLSVGEATVTSTDHPLVDAVEGNGGTVLVLDRAAQAEPSVVAQAATLHESGVRVRTLSLFYEEWLGKLPVSELERVVAACSTSARCTGRATGGSSASSTSRSPLAGPARVLVLVTPFVLVGQPSSPTAARCSTARSGSGRAAAASRSSSSARCGPTGDALRGRVDREDDPRITPFGRVLRRHPPRRAARRCVNILRGELSVVGPRPEQPHYVEELADKLPFYDLRHLVRPGLTGWAQVKYGYAGDERDALEKLQYEFFYLRHQGLALDLRIVGRTIRSVVAGDGR